MYYFFQKFWYLILTPKQFYIFIIHLSNKNIKNKIKNTEFKKSSNIIELKKWYFKAKTYYTKLRINNIINKKIISSSLQLINQYLLFYHY